MGKPIWTLFAEFKTRNKLSNQKITEIAHQYAYSEHQYARSHFCKTFSLKSEYVFYRILEFAIITKLVDEQTQDLIFLKLACNNCKHGGSDGLRRSMEHRDKILKLQHEYSVFFENYILSFSESDIFQICKEFGRDKLSVLEIAKMHETTSRVIQILLKKGLMVLFDTYMGVKNRIEK